MSKTNNTRDHQKDENSKDKNQNVNTENIEEDEATAQEMLEKYDRESSYRTRIGKCAWVITFVCVALTVFHMYAGYFGTLPSQKQGAVHLGTALGLIFLLYPAKKGWQHKQNTIPWYDVILAFTAMYV